MACLLRAARVRQVARPSQRRSREGSGDIGFGRDGVLVVTTRRVAAQPTTAPHPTPPSAPSLLRKHNIMGYYKVETKG